MCFFVYDADDPDSELDMTQIRLHNGWEEMFF